MTKLIANNLGLVLEGLFCGVNQLRKEAKTTPNKQVTMAYLHHIFDVAYDSDTNDELIHDMMYVLDLIRGRGLGRKFTDENDEYIYLNAPSGRSSQPATVQDLIQILDNVKPEDQWREEA